MRMRIVGEGEGEGVEDLSSRKLSFSTFLSIDICTIFVFDVFIFDIFAFGVIRWNQMINNIRGLIMKTKYLNIIYEVSIPIVE